MKRSVLLLVPVLLIAALAVPASASGAGWSITPSPNPRVPTGQLFWVSCPAADSCIAVGTYVKPSGAGVTLAEQWNGRSWRVLPTPNPAGTAVSGLLGVACTAPSACTAVGSSATATGASQAVAEQWNGIRWRIQPTPKLSQGGGLNGVSCTSASACTAVGGSGPGPLAERWNGANWSIQATPNAPQGNGFLSGVACTSATTCIAAGAANPFTPGATTLAESWDGNTWSIQHTPNPPQGGGELNGVSCTSASACTAAGNSNAGALAARWNGASWSLQSTPSLSGSQGAFLNSVACTSPSACTAVGAYSSSSGATHTLAEEWDGSSWLTKSTPNPAGTSLLIGVACASGTACTAVGYSNAAQTPAAVAERWNGSAWTVQAAANPPGVASSLFNSVACAAPSACTAVGASADSARTVISLAEQWNGRTWRIQPIPSPAGGGALVGVSCTSPSACTAVGAANPLVPGSRTLAERWDGTRWRIQATPNPAGVAGGALFGVSCTSGSSCVAVGTAVNDSAIPVGLFSERWDGRHWHLQAAPMPTGSPGSFFAGVSCASPSACTAVGARTDGAGNPVGTLAERWDGTNWSIQDTPNPPPGGVLAGVSCTSMTACTAAGNLNGTATSGTTTLIERWDGATWAIQPTPNPAAAYDVGLAAVACPTVSACIDVGGYANSSQKLTLAEQWNGNGQGALLAKGSAMTLGNSPSACPRAPLPGPAQGWRRISASPWRWPRAGTLLTPAGQAQWARPGRCPAG